MPETNDSIPQFQTAEFSGQPSAAACCVCHQPITGAHYRVNGKKVCEPCSVRVRNYKQQDTHAAYSRAILFGIGGALVGLILYSAVGILLHLEIGYVSLAVGYLVGKAMMKGSGNIGGRRYQWMAIALTYAAVSLSAVPVGISQYAQASRAQTTRLQLQGSATAQQDHAQTAQGESTGRSQAQKLTLGRMGALIGILALYGLASPVLGLMSSPLHGIIGIFILFIGVRIAWQITAGRTMPALEGPF